MVEGSGSIALDVFRYMSTLLFAINGIAGWARIFSGWLGGGGPSFLHDENRTVSE